ncbi:EF-P 5-aminopentanol modification-associated protein YfmH [Paenibacillus xerothermodurans]|uniref:Insulinase family protein n=1 Tax=Paenibacillus xerothermodurans TaxID=1977292 RepID=A0A2W1NGZ1_PAEXE|nr:pitrilysin family protein [Paenibacillus xerothermodurans]PZE22391.1 insulinase family protein [Paenibacillus xerothermodurans]
MKEIPYPHVKETLYSEQLPNGLSVYVLPKEGFAKTYATFSTKYGSMDNHFQVAGGEDIKVPDGIAHFLEHKMFEEPTGDVFSQFAARGASANAFTSFDRTAYLFSATEHIHENLVTLLNFVQKPHFTEESVEKEKGIIGQEIKMYQDNPDWRAYFGLIETMYHKHPIQIDIAGTIESISRITKELLYDCYNTFYHPSNMNLFVVGGVKPEEILELVKKNQAGKDYKPQGAIQRHFEEEPPSVKQREKVAVLPVSLPKCLFGCKEPEQTAAGNGMLKRELTMRVLLDVLLSPSSDIYQKLYDEQLISDNFGSEYNIGENYAFSVIGGDTKDPERLIATVREEIDAVKEQGVNNDDFERSRKKKIGGFLRQLNSPEAIANEFTKYRFKDIDLFDILPVYERMTLDDVNARLREHFNWNQLAASIVRSEQG